MLGITIGITPKAAYFDNTSSTRIAGGMAGYGMPGSSMKSISADRSLPFTTSLPTPPSPGRVSTFVVTPSISTSAWAPNCTTSTTRISGRLPPPVSRNRVPSADFGARSKVSSKPLWVSPEPTSTLTALKASTTSAGAGTGTGPMRNESLMAGMVAAVRGQAWVTCTTCRAAAG